MSIPIYLVGMLFYSFSSAFILWLAICYSIERKYFGFSLHIVLAISLLLQMAKFVFNA